MKIKLSQLKSLLTEAVRHHRVIRERPWAVEFAFRLRGGVVADSEGTGPDGLAINLVGQSGLTARLLIDTCWNPDANDKSGNEMRFEIGGDVVKHGRAYIPVKMDTGRWQRLIISNSPVPGFLIISHAPDMRLLSVAHLVVKNPFGANEDVDFSVESLGSGDVRARMLRFVNE